MQFNLTQNYEKEKALKQEFPYDLYLPFNSGRRVGQAPANSFTQGGFNPIPNDRVSILGWINNAISEGTIDVGGNTSFISLPDTPSSFGAIGQSLQVNATGDAIEWYTPPVEVPVTLGVGSDPALVLSGQELTLTLPAGSSDSFIGLTDTPINMGSPLQVLRVNAIGSALEFVNPTTGITAHSGLTGLGDDDHPQYHNDTRGDIRYYLQSQVDTFLLNKSDIGHTHDLSDLNTTGTSSNTTYLRGDGVWSTLPSYSAANGLNAVANEFRLGGELEENTLIEGGNYGLTFTDFDTVEFAGVTSSILFDNLTIQGSTALKIKTPNVYNSSALVGQVLKLTNVDGTVEFQAESAGGATAFTSLIDTPGALGTANQILQVNGAGNALEFIDVATGTSYNAANGLTLDVDDFRLGGTLDDHTTIDGGGNVFAINNAIYNISVPQLAAYTTGATYIESDTLLQLKGVTSVQLVTPAVDAATATTGQLLSLSNHLTGEVEYVDMPTPSLDYTDLGDTPATMGTEDIVPTVNAAGTALEHIPGHIFHVASGEDHASIIVTSTDASELDGFTTTPHETTVIGHQGWQDYTVDINFNDTVDSTVNFTVLVTYANTSAKYNFQDFYIEATLDGVPGATTETYTSTSASFQYTMGVTAGVAKTFTFRCKIKGRI